MSICEPRSLIGWLMIHVTLHNLLQWQHSDYRSVRASLSRWHVYLQCKLRSGVYTPNLASFIINPDTHKLLLKMSAWRCLVKITHRDCGYSSYSTLQNLYSAQNMVKFHGNESSNATKASEGLQWSCIARFVYMGGTQFKTRQVHLSYNRSPIVSFIVHEHARRIFSGKLRTPISILPPYP